MATLEFSFTGEKFEVLNFEVLNIDLYSSTPQDIAEYIDQCGNEIGVSSKRSPYQWYEFIFTINNKVCIYSNNYEKQTFVELGIKDGQNIKICMKSS